MSKIHYINANDFGGGGGGESDVDLSQYATKLYSDSEDTKVKEYVDSQLDSLELPDTEINLDGYATEAELEEVDRSSQERDEALQNEIDELSESVNLDDYATIEYSDKKDNELWAEIDDLQTEVRTNSYRVSTVLDEDAVGEAVFSNPGAKYTSQGSITFSQKDLSGHSIHWPLIKPGWAFTITEKDSDDYAVGEVKSINSNNNSIQVRILEGEGSPMFGDILHFSGSPYVPMSSEDTDTPDYATVAYTDDQDRKHLASANAYTNEVTAALDTETDVTADYDWTGHHKYTGGNVEIDNTDGGVMYHGWKSDYSGTNDRSFMKFQLNANSETWLHFGPTSSYWETRWTLNGGKMTWAATHSGTTSVAIDKYGLKVNGSSVTRNATMLQALKGSTDFESLKAKLVELLEAEVATYEVDEEEGC